MNYQKWNEGDWCWCEFKLQMIKEVEEDGRVTTVTDGMFSHGSWDLRDRMYPLDLRAKLVSDEFKHCYDLMHQYSKKQPLNFPDIFRWLVQKWCECMEDRLNDDHIKAKYAELKQFTDKIKEVCKTPSEQFDGVKLFR